MNVINVDVYSTLVCMVLVLLLGRLVISKISFLQKYHIPEPVVGGIIVAFIIMIAHNFYDFNLKFDSSLKDPLMLAFFITIGLSADFASFKKGGKVLAIFLVAISVFVVLQNSLGIAVATLIGSDPLMGLLGGSISLVGGHGTSAAWSNEFVQAPYNYPQGLEISIVCATFGLISGGLIGGPVAQYLIKKHNLAPDEIQKDELKKGKHSAFESPEEVKLITSKSFVESLALIAIALLIGTKLATFAKSSGITLPTFVWCLFIGVVLRNTLEATKIHTVFDREVSVLGNVSLSLFLAYALMSINLIELANLALPILIILVAQITLAVVFGIFVTFKVCGANYDAAVLTAGYCGFGLGATPTAMVNMQTVTNHYGHSHVAFIVVPLVGAFFIDIINAFVIKGFLTLPFFG